MISNKKVRKIYIVLTHTGTILSRLIKYYTQEEFSHISIAFDENLDEMYSFGRRNAYNPFIGGFVREGIDFGTFKRFSNTKAAIYSFEVTDKQYKKIKKIVNKMERKKYLYKFNFIGLFAVSLNIKVSRQNHFYCAEFVKYLIDESKIELDLPQIVKPGDFIGLEGFELKYNGVLKNYKEVDY